ncbi:MAG: acylphosphatase, partial [Bacteroidota bacterium]
MRHLNIWVSGKVQGVFYRRFIVDQAQQLGVKGLVKNLPDGRVYIEAEGTTDQLKVFETFC